MSDIKCNSLCELIDETFKESKASKTKIISKDMVMPRGYGFLSYQTGDIIYVNLTNVYQGQPLNSNYSDESVEYLVKLIKTMSGRVELAELLSYNSLFDNADHFSKIINPYLKLKVFI